MKFTKLLSLLIIATSLLVLGACKNASSPTDDPIDDPIVQQAPATPVNFTIASGNTKAQLVWTSVTGATSYNVYWSLTTGVTPTNGNKQTVSSPTFSHLGLINSQTYYYVVTAVNAAGESAPSEEKIATPQDPTTPNNVNVVAGNETTIIGWLPIVEANGYNIYWSTSPGVTKYNSTKIENAGNPYSHPNLVNGTKYFYRVTSMINGVESPLSFEVSGTPMNPFLETPAGITATPGVNSATVSWGTALNADSYTLYYSTTQNDLSSAIKISGVTSPTVIPNLNGGKTYYVSVVTVQGAQESTPARTTSVIPNGLCYESSASGYILKGCRGPLINLNIPSTFQGTTVTSIADYAFKGADVSGNLSIPSTITSIGEGAFYDCNKLTGNLSLPEGLTEVAQSTFLYCSGLTGTITLPASLTKISSNAFQYCKKITAVYFGNSKVSLIGVSAFSDCYSLVKVAKTSDDSGTAVYIPETLTECADCLFAGCTKLAGTLTIPDNVTSIGEFAFQDCASLTGNLIIPDTVSSVGRNAFQGCSGFTGSLYVSSKITNIPNYTFYYCSGLSGSVTLPAGLTTIDYKAFQGCSKLSGNLAIPSGVSAIGGYAFSGCAKITGLSLPTANTAIGEYAFSGCSSLAALSIPEGIASIGDYAFNNCTGLSGGINLPSTLTTIGTYVFKGCTSLTGTLTIQNGLTSLSDNAFRETKFTGSLVIPGSVKTIGNGAFSSCSGLNGTLTLTEGITTIGEYSFSNTNFTGTITLPSTLTTLNYNAFYSCAGLTGSIVLPEGITTYDMTSFAKCPGLTGTITIPASVTMVSSYTTDPISFKVIKFMSATPDGSLDFSDWPNLVTVYVPTGSVAAYKTAVGASSSAYSKITAY